MKNLKYNYKILFIKCILIFIIILHSNTIFSQDYTLDVCQGEIVECNMPNGPCILCSATFTDMDNCFYIMPQPASSDYFNIWFGHSGNASFKVKFVGTITGIVYATWTYSATIHDCVDNCNCIDDYTITSLLQNITYMTSASSWQHHYETFTDALYSVHNNLSTDGTISIEPGYNYTFTADNSIHLTEGFTAEIGSNFSAIIQDCTPHAYHGNAKIISESKPNDSLAYGEQIANMNSIIKNSYQKINMSIIPNPFDKFIIIKFVPDSITQLPFDVIIFDIYGKEILKYSIISEMSKISTSMLNSGSYIISIRKNNYTLINQVIIKY